MAARPSGLTHAADLALYRAKDDGRATFRAFETEMAERIRQRRLLQMDLRPSWWRSDRPGWTQAIDVAGRFRRSPCVLMCSARQG
jgi:predicted signal transduction protein with EAL and GGDEF domain